MNSWGTGKVCAEGDRINIGEVNPWGLEWIRCDVPAVYLPHPLYRYQKHRMHIYKVVSGDLEVIFAAGELSAGVWGFYEEVEDAGAV